MNIKLADANFAIMLSNWYSGATLLAILLDQHADIICNGETFPFSPEDKRRYVCSCGEFIDECNFYKYTTQANSEDKKWDHKNYVILPNFSDIHLINKIILSPKRDSLLRYVLINYISGIKQKYNEFLEAQFSFMRNAIKFKNATVYLDGTKSITRAQMFANAHNEEIKVIHLLRDGRGFCNSFVKNNKLSKSDFLMAAKLWNDYISLVEQLEKKYKNLSVLHIKYEEICNDTNTALSKIYDHLCIDKTNTNQSFEHHVLGNRMRKNFDNRIIEDKSWESEIDEKQIVIITKKMKKYLKKYNYI
jgi:hypothetical protein